MLKMSSQIEKIVNIYKKLAKIPTITAARVNNDGNKICSLWSVRNLDKSKLTKYQYSYNLDKDLNVIADSDFGTDISNVLISSVSPKETFKALIREEKESKDVKKQYLEVWRANQLEHSIDLNALDVHGDVYVDSEFGGLEWSSDETKLVYVAERKLPKSEPYIKRKSIKDGEGESKPINKGSEFVYRQDWGEQLVGKHLSVVVVCTLADESVNVIDGLPESWCPGQVSFAPEGDSVVGLAFHTEPRRYGLIFCTNRAGCIFKLPLDSELKYTVLSSEGMSVRAPRFSPNGKWLVWLQRTEGGPHHAGHQLVGVPWPTHETLKCFIDIVKTEMSISGDGKFYGMYNLTLPKRCFSKDSNRIFFSTPQRHEIRSYSYCISSDNIVDISLKKQGSTIVYDVNNDLILTAFTNFTTPLQLNIAKLPAEGKEHDINFKLIGKPITVPELEGNVTEYMELRHDDCNDNVKSFTAMYFAPNSDKKMPLITWPHGGPHVASVNAYSLEAAMFSILGFASLQINYRGSTGAGDSSVRFLPRNVGNTDVKDCKMATDEAVRLYKVDANRLCLYGGSHGGFLVAHLSGQYPDVYSAVVSRNPVIDVASMFNTSDIPDWCAVEAGFVYTEKGPVSEEEFLYMRRCSPLSHVHSVKAPTALMLGGVDKRVPHYQGLEYYRRLKANGCVAKVFMYDDNHSLSSIPAEMDNVINSANWFMTHLNVE